MGCLSHVLRWSPLHQWIFLRLAFHDCSAVCVKRLQLLNDFCTAMRNCCAIPLTLLAQLASGASQHTLPVFSGLRFQGLCYRWSRVQWRLLQGCGYRGCHLNLTLSLASRPTTRTCAWRLHPAMTPPPPGPGMRRTQTGDRDSTM